MRVHTSAMSLDPVAPTLPIAPASPTTPWYKLPGFSRREKLLVVLAIVAVLYGVLKRPETKTVTIIDKKIVKVDRWHEQKLSKDWLNLRGFAGTTLKILPDGTYVVMGPFDLTTSRFSQSETTHDHSETETTHQRITTEPAVAWRLLIKGSVLTPINKLQPGWSLGVAAHIGKVSLLGLKFDVGAGGEVIRIGPDTFIGPQLLATF